MVDMEEEFKSYLVNFETLRPATANNYVSHLRSTSQLMEFPVDAITIGNTEDLNDKIKKLERLDLTDGQFNDRRSALRAYHRFVQSNYFPIDFPDEIENSPQYPEGAKKQITVNAYERNRAARQKCLDIKGLDCSVCEMSFEQIYGEIGKGFIHVHHIKPLSEIGENYTVNPIEDLSPVCPNCHAMLHRNKEPLTIAKLKEIYETTNL